MRMYLDYNAGAPLRAEVWAAMAAIAREPFGNPSSIHWAGRAGQAAIQDARAEVAALIGAAPLDVVFTSGGTEANNLAIRGLLTNGRRRHVVTTAIEHTSVLETCQALARSGYDVTSVRVDSVGRVDPAAVADTLRHDTALASIGLANNEVGTIQPVRQIAAETQARGVPLHVDAVQAAGKVPLDVGAIGADLLSLSAHKLGGPQGIGALWVRPGLRLTPQLVGGFQERGRRAGTENVAGIVGFGAAARLARGQLEQEGARQRQLLARLWSGIAAAVPDVQRNSPSEGVLPNTLNVSLPDADADGLVIGLDLLGIAVSAGSACAAGALKPSHVLLAMHRSPAVARSALRISTGIGTREEDIDYLLAVLPGVVERSRRTLRAGVAG
jgi:cysteine desulfurase